MTCQCDPRRNYIDRLGYDPVDVGPLAAGHVFQPGTEISSGSHTSSEIELLAGDAQLIHA